MEIDKEEIIRMLKGNKNYEIAQIGMPVVPVLLEALWEDDKIASNVASVLLGMVRTNYDQDWTPIVRPLIKFVNEKGSFVGNCIKDGLVLISERSLAARINDKNKSVRSAAFSALGAIMDSIGNERIFSLAVPCLLYRNQINTIKGIAKDRESVPIELSQSLNHRDSIVRTNALKCLRYLYPDHKWFHWEWVVPALTGRLNDRKHCNRDLAAAILGDIAKDHSDYDWAPVVRALIANMGPCDRTIGFFRIIGGRGDTGDAVVSALVDYLGSDDPDVREKAGEAIAERAARRGMDLAPVLKSMSGFVERTRIARDPIKTKAAEHEMRDRYMAIADAARRQKRGLGMADDGVLLEGKPKAPEGLKDGMFRSARQVVMR